VRQVVCPLALTLSEGTSIRSPTRYIVFARALQARSLPCRVPLKQGLGLLSCVNRSAGRWTREPRVAAGNPAAPFLRPQVVFLVVSDVSSTATPLSPRSTAARAARWCILGRESFRRTGGCIGQGFLAAKLFRRWSFRAVTEERRFALSTGARSVVGHAVRQRLSRPTAYQRAR